MVWVLWNWRTASLPASAQAEGGPYKRPERQRERPKTTLRINGFSEDPPLDHVQWSCQRQPFEERQGGEVSEIAVRTGAGLVETQDFEYSAEPVHAGAWRREHQ